MKELKMNKGNIPVIVQQIGENALDKSQRSDVRFNYASTLENIKLYCEDVLKKYHGKKF